MNNFLQRTITTDSVEYIDQSGFPVAIIAKRTRTSMGFASITIAFGDQSIEFNSNYMADYEEAARELAMMLLEMVNDPCELPVIEAES